VFSILVIPLTTVRWIEFKTSLHVPSEWPLIVHALFDLVGFVDVVLFFKTRRGLLLFEKFEDDTGGEDM
jgi:hypothetical protein